MFMHLSSVHENWLKIMKSFSMAHQTTLLRCYTITFVTLISISLLDVLMLYVVSGTDSWFHLRPLEAVNGEETSHRSHPYQTSSCIDALCWLRLVVDYIVYHTYHNKTVLLLARQFYIHYSHDQTLYVLEDALTMMSLTRTVHIYT